MWLGIKARSATIFKQIVRHAVFAWPYVEIVFSESAANDFKEPTVRVLELVRAGFSHEGTTKSIKDANKVVRHSHRNAPSGRRSSAMLYRQPSIDRVLSTTHRFDEVLPSDIQLDSNTDVFTS